MNFIKKFKSMVTPTIQLIILTVILVLVAIDTLSFSLGIEAIIGWVALLLMFIGVVYLVLNQKFFASYVVVFILYFADAFSKFFSDFINITFDPFTFTISSDIMLYLSLIIFVYLALMIASYVVNGGLKSRPLKGKVATLTLIFFAFFWLFLGFNAALILMPIVGIAFIFGNHKSTILFIVSFLITYVYDGFNGIFNAFTLDQLIVLVLEILLLVYAVMIALPLFFPKTQQKPKKVEKKKTKTSPKK